MTTNENPTSRERSAEFPSGSEQGSLTILDSSNAGSTTLSTRPPNEPATSSKLSRADVVRPTDGAYSSLTEAAYWIATEGGVRDFDGNDPEIWRSAFDSLINKIVASEVAVIGRCGGGLYETIPATHFVDLKVSYPYCGQPSDFASGDAAYLQCWGIVDEEHRRNGFDDKLFVGGLNLEWSDLRVRGADIARLWPFGSAQPPLGTSGAASPSTMTAPSSPRGAKIKYDWPDVRDFVFKTMNENGEFKEWDVGSNWCARADLERLVMQYMDNMPSEASVKSYVRRFLAEWHRSQQANN